MKHSNNKKRLDYALHLASAREAIKLAIANSCNPVVTTKFTEGSAVLLHLVSKLRADIPIIWVDTGYNTRATLDYSKDLSAMLNLSLLTYKPRDHIITIPPDLDSPEHSDFVHQVKLEPFGRALADIKPDAWLSSIRRYQSEHRSKLPVFDVMADGLLKVSPLLDWSQESVEQYCKDFGLPLGPPCYDPTKGEPFRECGLHFDQAHQKPSADSVIEAEFA